MKTLSMANGDFLPMIGLGTFKSDQGEIYEVIRDALELGYRHIDCAPIYGNQAEIGAAIKDTLNSDSLKREDLWLTSKLWNDSHAPEAVKPAIEKTLSELKIDVLDLYLMHWPVAIKPGLLFPETADDMIPLTEQPIEATWQAMEELVDIGLCRHIGVSNFNTKNLTALLDSARIRPEVNQIELHPYLQQPEMFRLCQTEGVVLTAYSPLGSTDRPERLKTPGEPILLQDPVILAIAEKHAATPAQILLSWLLHQGAVAIPKSTRKERLKENLAAERITLSSEEQQHIKGLDLHRRYYKGEIWALEGSSYSYESLWND